MSSKCFECFVEISDQKYEIVLNDKDVNLVSFEEIYPKIQQIVKIVLNEDIDFNTHEFKQFNKNSRKGSIIKFVYKLIPNKSIIRLRPKPRQLNVSSSDVKPLPQSTSNASTQPYLRDVPTNQLPVLCQPKDMPKSDIHYNPYCNICPVLTDINTYPLSKTSRRFLSNNFRIYSKVFPLFDKISEISDNNFSEITENDWIQVIPQYMRQYDKSTDDWKKLFKRLTKNYVRILKLCENRVQACNLFPFFHYFESINFDSNLKTFKDINSLRLKAMNGHTIKLNNNKKRSENKKFEVSLKELIRCRKNIEEFHSIVMAIDIRWEMANKYNSNPYWLQIDQELNGKRSASGSKNGKRGKKLRQKFETWTKFYAQNYDRLNAKLETKHQKIFDLLKIIHILDVQKVIPKARVVYNKIIEISLRDEFKDYYEKHLKAIRMRKLEAINNSDEKYLITGSSNTQSFAPNSYEINRIPTDSYNLQFKSERDSDVSQNNEKSSKFERPLKREFEEMANVGGYVDFTQTNKKLKPNH